MKNVFNKFRFMLWKTNHNVPVLEKLHKDIKDPHSLCTGGPGSLTTTSIANNTNDQFVTKATTFTNDYGEKCTVVKNEKAKKKRKTRNENLIKKISKQNIEKKMV